MSETNILEPKIVDFIGWCGDVEKELPFGQDQANENRKRTGAKEPLYPPQYYAGQYPALWKVPAAADSPYYQSINKRK
jgi:hypothetical protein